MLPWIWAEMKESQAGHHKPFLKVETKFCIIGYSLGIFCWSKVIYPLVWCGISYCGCSKTQVEEQNVCVQLYFIIMEELKFLYILCSPSHFSVFYECFSLAVTSTPHLAQQLLLPWVEDPLPRVAQWCSLREKWWCLSLPPPIPYHHTHHITLGAKVSTSCVSLSEHLYVCVGFSMHVLELICLPQCVYCVWEYNILCGHVHM